MAPVHVTRVVRITLTENETDSTYKETHDKIVGLFSCIAANIWLALSCPNDAGPRNDHRNQTTTILFILARSGNGCRFTDESLIRCNNQVFIVRVGVQPERDRESTYSRGGILGKSGQRDAVSPSRTGRGSNVDRC